MARDEEMREVERQVIAGTSDFRRFRWRAWRREQFPEPGCDAELHQKLGEGSGTFFCPCCGSFEENGRKGATNVGG